MPDWLAVVAALLGGGVAAGAAFYVLGRRVERRAAVAAAGAAARESERLLEEARQRMVFAAKEELIKSREAWDEDLGRRRRDIERREDQLDQKLAGLEGQGQEIGRREQACRERERAVAAQEAEARARHGPVAGLSGREAKQYMVRGLGVYVPGQGAAIAR